MRSRPHRPDLNPIVMIWRDCRRQDLTKGDQHLRKSVRQMTGGLTALFIMAHVACAAAAAADLTGIWTWYLPDGSQQVSMWPLQPPYTDEGRRKVGAYRKWAAATGETPQAFCVGVGVPGAVLDSGPSPMEIIQRPEQVTIIFEAPLEVRRIYIGGPRISPADLFPSRTGYSTGRWDGDVLVVETVALAEQIDHTAAHSADASIVERYRVAMDKVGHRILIVDMVVTDPRFYTEPVSVRKVWAQMQQGRMLEYDCNEAQWNQRLRTLPDTGPVQDVP